MPVKDPALLVADSVAFHKGRNEALENLPGGGVEHDNRLGRAHQQDGAAIGLDIRIQSDGFGAHRRTEFNDLAGRRQRLVVRRDDRPILLRANGAIGIGGLWILSLTQNYG